MFKTFKWSDEADNWNPNVVDRKGYFLKLGRCFTGKVWDETIRVNKLRVAFKDTRYLANFRTWRIVKLTRFFMLFGFTGSKFSSVRVVNMPV